MEYRHMSGTIKGSRAIADLHFQDDLINGSCLFPDIIIEDEQGGAMIYTERMEGSIDDHGVISLTAYNRNILIGTYNGLMKEEFSGTFRAEGGNADGSFRLAESYDAGAIPFEGFCLSMDSVLLDSIGSPMAHTNMKLLLPPAKENMHGLRAEILKLFLGKEMPAQIPDDSILYIISMEYFSRYIESNRDIYDGGASFNWEIINDCYISMNHSGIVVYRTDSYAYTGGAHGMGVSRFMVYDIEMDKRIQMHDIFIPQYQDTLSTLLERKYRTMNHLEDDEPLTEAGLFADNIPPSENFYLTENGIGFYYNPYKIAPYAMGAQVISLSWKEMESIINNEAAILQKMIILRSKQTY